MRSCESGLQFCAVDQWCSSVLFALHTVFRGGKLIPVRGKTWQKSETDGMDVQVTSVVSNGLHDLETIRRGI